MTLYFPMLLYRALLIKEIHSVQKWPEPSSLLKKDGWSWQFLDIFKSPLEKEFSIEM